MHEPKVTPYYNNNKFEDINFAFSEITAENILNILKGLNPSKAVGIDDIPGKFLKDGANVLERPGSQLCNLYQTQLVS